MGLPFYSSVSLRSFERLSISHEMTPPSTDTVACDRYKFEPVIAYLDLIFLLLKFVARGIS